MPRPRFIPLLLVLAATGAVAQSRHDSRAPIAFSAGHGELQDKANKAILPGGVVIRQAEMTLQAARVTVSYTGRLADGSPPGSRLAVAGGAHATPPHPRARRTYTVSAFQL